MTRRIVALAGLGALALGLAACGGEGKAAEPVARPTTTIAAAHVIKPGTGTFGSAKAAACDTDYTVFSSALELYLTMNGESQATEQAMIDAGVLREESVLHDIGPGNTVVPSPSGGCLK